MLRAASTLVLVFTVAAPAWAQPFEEMAPPEWVRGVTRMTFGTPGEAVKAADAGAQVLHTNLVWPYYPLRRDGGGLSADDCKKLRDLVETCHKCGLKVVLGVPPFMSVAHAAKHPDWRVRPGPGALPKPPSANDLGTRSGCNAFTKIHPGATPARPLLADSCRRVPPSAVIPTTAGKHSQRRRRRFTSPPGISLREK